MRKSEFKKILKPLIEQTVREVLLSEGVLSTVIAEVAKGMSTAPVVVENNQPTKKRSSQKDAIADQVRRKERLKSLSESIGFDNIDIFDGVEPIVESSGPGAALSGVAPSDPGVDISAIQKISNGKWKALVEGVK
jgi:hypothetical protein